MGYDYEDEIKEIMVEYGLDRCHATNIFLRKLNPSDYSADPYIQMENEKRLYDTRHMEDKN